MLSQEKKFLVANAPGKYTLIKNFPTTEKKMNKFLALAVAFAIAVAIACSGGYSAPSGSIMQNTVLHTAGQDGLQGGPTDLGSKTGEACANGIVGIISSGDAGVKAAAAAGGITTVKGIDYRNDNLLGSVLQNTCTIVHGD